MKFKTRTARTSARPRLSSLRTCFVVVILAVFGLLGYSWSHAILGTYSPSPNANEAAQAGEPGVTGGVAAAHADRAQARPLGTVQLLSAHCQTVSSVRGNLGEANVVTEETIDDWLKDRWQNANSKQPNNTCRVPRLGACLCDNTCFVRYGGARHSGPPMACRRSSRHGCSVGDGGVGGL